MFIFYETKGMAFGLRLRKKIVYRIDSLWWAIKINNNKNESVLLRLNNHFGHFAYKTVIIIAEQMLNYCPFARVHLCLIFLYYYSTFMESQTYGSVHNTIEFMFMFHNSHHFWMDVMALLKHFWLWIDESAEMKAKLIKFGSTLFIYLTDSNLFVTFFSSSFHKCSLFIKIGRAQSKWYA